MSKLFALLCLFAATSCTAIYQNHGYVPNENELAELVVGVDSRATVDDVIGPPSASGVLSEGDYYYIRSRIRTFGMFKPEVVERQVLAISFDDSDTVANIERFSLADGNIIPLTRRVTDSSVVNNGFLRQLLGNIGNFDPADFLN
ncbi:outer membrane protein assembly factor BamE [uncultured Roseovarius sp.]|uniref:outer membrane protein assembly factor BamE n=1 Tax=uncultured Roseovarius sp. TaxID=293344 RepID=UPI00345BE38C